MPTDRSKPLVRFLRRIHLSSLSYRLFVLLFAVIAIAFAIYASDSIRTTSESYLQYLQVCTERFSDTIQRSTHYSMLLNRKEDVHHIIRTIAEQRGIVDVRVFDKQGVIIFSADEEDIGERVDLQAEACVSCHDRDTPLESVPADSRARIFELEEGGRVFGFINPIENAPECYNAACHAHPQEQKILGVLDVTMSMAEADRSLASVRRRAVMAAWVMALLAGLFSVAFIIMMVRKPVNQLIKGAESVAGGDLDTEILINSSTEMGQLADSFNKMTGDLRTARQELTDWSDRLETRLQEKTEELSRSQQQVAHMDKMASLGKLAATVAHELNNPLAGILNYAKLVNRTLEESEEEIPERDELQRHVSMIHKEANRSGAIVRNLLIFARPGGVELALHPLNQIVDRSVMLIRHHLEMSEVNLEIEQFDGDDHIICDADQLEQALVALLINAVEAMPEGGSLRLLTEGSEESVQITIADTGVGIPEDALSRIFEPFYTSKEETEGAGLGLAVVYGIVQRHGGEIEVRSELDLGTTFQITVPRRPPVDEDLQEAEFLNNT